MISKIYRFHGHHALDFTYRKGRTVRVEKLSLRFAPSRNKQYRLAVVVSKKVAKSAVTRNRIRRRIFEAVRLIHRENPLPPNDIILSVHDESVAVASQAELGANIEKLLSKMA